MTPFIGEIRVFPYGFAPSNWMLCNGATLSISQYFSLFAIIGTQYGGNGITTVAIPDLRGATALCAGNYLPSISSEKPTQYYLAQSGGSPIASLTESQLPAHYHVLSGAVAPNSISLLTRQAETDGSSYLSNLVSRSSARSGTPSNAYGEPTGDSKTTVSLNEAAISETGDIHTHSNIQPYLALNYYICLQGHSPIRQ